MAAVAVARLGAAVAVAEPVAEPGDGPVASAGGADSERTGAAPQFAIMLGLGELFVISIADIQVFSVGLFSSS